MNESEVRIDVPDGAEEVDPTLEVAFTVDVLNNELLDQELPKQFMTDFYGKVQQIHLEMAQLRENLVLLREKHDEALESVTSDQAAAVGFQIEALERVSRDLSREISQDLKAMDVANQTFSEKMGAGAAETRIRHATHASSVRKFMKLTQEFEHTQQQFTERFKQTLQRQYKHTNPLATEDELEEVATGDGGSIFKDQILGRVGTASHAAATNALADIVEKHEDILRLEESILELHQMFLDMAVLVQHQGEILNVIENNVAQAVVYTSNANDQLFSAAKHQRKYRKRLLILGVILIVLIIVFGSPLLSGALLFSLA